MENVKIYAEILDSASYTQLKRVSSSGIFEKQICIMPDAHAGKGCMVGFTGELGDRIPPSLLGSDIGCGVEVAEITEPLDDSVFSRIDDIIRNGTGRGTNTNMRSIRIPSASSLGLSCYRMIDDDGSIDSSFGTIGGGNHFIEIDVSDDGKNYLLVHSGSRILGVKVEEYYSKLAEETHPSCKESPIPYLSGKQAESYLHDMAICVAWAKASRESITNSLCLSIENAFHTIHNYIDSTRMLRKGAVSAAEGEKLIIPMNMRDGAIIGLGRGSVDWNISAPHGAGRKLSRSAAKEAISLDEYTSTMSSVWSSSICRGTVSESPQAYKDAASIMLLIEPTVSITSFLTPLYNFKPC